MASIELQLAEIIHRLLDKTKESGVAWESTPQPGKYQTRQGDFVINIIGRRAPPSLIEVVLTVHRLNGRFVGSAATNPNSMIAIVNQARMAAPGEAKDKLIELYGLITGEGDDLDDLLKIL